MAETVAGDARKALWAGYNASIATTYTAEALAKATCYTVYSYCRVLNDPHPIIAL